MSATMVRAGQQLRMWLGHRGPQERYQSHLPCPACGAINRRELRRDDRACWSCGQEIPLITVSLDVSPSQNAERTETPPGHALAS